METEGRRKIDEFAEESRILENARLTLAKIDLTPDQWRQHYEQLVEAYANLLESARVLTRNSDRLQRKLDEANRKLEMQNKLLEKEAEEALLKSESVLQVNKRLAEEKMQLDTRINRVQMALIVMVAVLTVVILFMLYYLIFDPERAIRLMQQFRK
jgi:predicted PurR-regulated permease PerM